MWTARTNWCATLDITQIERYERTDAICDLQVSIVSCKLRLVSTPEPGLCYPPPDVSTLRGRIGQPVFRLESKQRDICPVLVRRRRRGEA